MCILEVVYEVFFVYFFYDVFKGVFFVFDDNVVEVYVYFVVFYIFFFVFCVFGVVNFCLVVVLDKFFEGFVFNEDVFFSWDVFIVGYCWFEGEWMEWVVIESYDFVCYFFINFFGEWCGFFNKVFVVEGWEEGVVEEFSNCLWVEY